MGRDKSASLDSHDETIRRIRDAAPDRRHRSFAPSCRMEAAGALRAIHPRIRQDPDRGMTDSRLRSARTVDARRAARCPEPPSVSDALTSLTENQPPYFSMISFLPLPRMPYFAPTFLKAAMRELEVVASRGPAESWVRMRACALGHHREEEADHVDPLGEQVARDVLRQLGVVEHHRHDRAVAGLDVEAGLGEPPCASSVGVPLQLVAALGASSRSGRCTLIARGDDHRRHGVGEQVRAAPSAGTSRRARGGR